MRRTRINDKYLSRQESKISRELLTSSDFAPSAPEVLSQTKKNTPAIIIQVCIDVSNPFSQEEIVLFCDRCCFFLSSIELIHRTRLEKCFLSSIKWMTLTACFYSNFVTCDRTSCSKCISTRTCDLYLLIVWMNT